METSHKLAAMTLALLVLALGLLTSTRNVSAAAEGKITGTVKLDGTAPHMKGSDRSKDLYCVKQHENNPAHLGNVVVGSGGGLENVVLYIAEGLTGGATTAVPSREPTFDQKNCIYTPHVLALDVNQKFKVTTSDQTTHNIHPLPNAMTGNIPGTSHSRREHPLSRPAGKPRR